LEIKMPELDGIQFLKQLRHCKPGLPVLTMTGYPSIDGLKAAASSDAWEWQFAMVSHSVFLQNAAPWPN